MVIVLQTTIATRTLSAFPGDRLSNVLLNSAAKIFRLIRVSPHGWCHPGRPTPPPGDATDPHSKKVTDNQHTVQGGPKTWTNMNMCNEYLNETACKTPDKLASFMSYLYRELKP